MKSDSQASLAYKEIRRQILIMQLQPNFRLKEDAWAKKMKMSRMAIREALTRLFGEGLVTSGPKGGYFVAEMTAEDIHQIWEVRQILELAAVRLAVERISQAQIDVLKKICDDFSELVEKEYVAGACEADIKFHEKLVESSGNNRLLKAYNYSHIPLFHQKLGKTGQYLNDYQETDKEHREIVGALEKRDLKLAEEMLKKHFKRGAKAVLDLE